MTLNPNGPDELERKLGKPIEEMAEALEPTAFMDHPGHNEGQCAYCDDDRKLARRHAKAAMTVLRRHGWITSDCIDAIHAEEDDNGEARSSIIGGGK